MRIVAGLAAALTLLVAPAAHAAGIGEYNREPIENYAPDSLFVRLGRPIGRVDILTDAGVFPCSGFLVEGNRLVTPQYCVPGILKNSKAKATEIQGVTFVAGYLTNGSDEGTEKFRVDPTPLEENKELQFSVLKVFGDANARYGAVSLGDYLPPEDSPLWLIGHPMGEEQRISRENCKVANPETSGGLIAHTCDSLPGDSGAAILDPGTGMVVAMHSAGSSRDAVNYAVSMTRILESSAILAASPAPDTTGSPMALLDALLSPDPETLVKALDELASGDRDPVVRAKAQRLLDTLRLEMTARD